MDKHYELGVSEGLLYGELPATLPNTRKCTGLDFAAPAFDYLKIFYNVSGYFLFLQCVDYLRVLRCIDYLKIFCNVSLQIFYDVSLTIFYNVSLTIFYNVSLKIFYIVFSKIFDNES